MDYNKFRDISCCEEFEIQCDLRGISKIDILKEIGHKIDDYYFFVSNDGVFNWYDLDGNHVENPGILKEIREKYIPKTITKCIIPNGVKMIGTYSFYECNSLKEIIIPNNVPSIGVGVFCNCDSLISITIPNSVKNIGDFSFYECNSLKEITIPNSVKNIGEYSFYHCISLKEITIPNSVRSIKYRAFSHCISLKKFIFKGRTLEKVKRMNNYPFGIEDESIIKVSEI